MILGKMLSTGEAAVKVKLRGPGGMANVEAIVDTGFNDEFTLPAWAIQNLGLKFVLASDYILADGARSSARVYAGEIEWLGTWREIDIVELEGNPLLGMAALSGCHLGIDVISNGIVEVRLLAGRAPAAAI